MSYFDPPKSPHSPEALTVKEVGPGIRFAVMQDGEEVKTGTFLEGTHYDGEEWAGVKAEIEPEGEIEPVSMYGTGIVCSRTGEWPTSFVIEKPVGVDV